MLMIFKIVLSCPLCGYSSKEYCIGRFESAEEYARVRFCPYCGERLISNVFEIPFWVAVEEAGKFETFKNQ